MLSLIKIRVKYITRKPCLLFWTYLFLPIIITIAGFFSMSNKKALELKQYRTHIFNETKQFFNNGDNYDYIKSELGYTGFLVNEKEDCNVIEAVLNEFNLMFSEFPKCEDAESKFDNYTLNIIKIDKDDGKYTVDLTSRDTFVGVQDQFLFDKEDLNQDLIIDPYYVSNQENPALTDKFHTFFVLE